jgi:hypothetical protein
VYSVAAYFPNRTRSPVLRLFLGRIGDDDATLLLLRLFDRLDDDPIG